jgi:NRPS condensation-like uncharacterized protein
MSFSVVGQDVATYLFGKYLTNSQNDFILKLNGRINETLLCQAVQLSLEAEPILGCYFVEDDANPIWKQSENLDSIELCSLITTNQAENEINQFITTPFEKTDCQLKVKIIRAETDTVCIKVNHACSDGGGFKQYLNMLVAIYNGLLNKQQEIVKSGVSKVRSQEQVFCHPDVASHLDFLKQLDEFNSMPTVALPFSVGDNSEQTWITGKLDAEHLNAVKKFARAHNVTVNDVLFTAHNRALTKIAEIENSLISAYLTIDLRRYLQNPQAMCNLVGMPVVTIHYDSKEAFTETLSKVVIETKKVKEQHLGLKNAIDCEMFGNLGFKEADTLLKQIHEKVVQNRFSTPIFSNIGIVAEDIIEFGPIEVVDCYMMGPVQIPPGLLMVISIYNNQLTIAVKFFQSRLKKEIVQWFIDSMLKELKTVPKMEV